MEGAAHTRTVPRAHRKRHRKGRLVSFGQELRTRNVQLCSLSASAVRLRHEVRFGNGMAFVLRHTSRCRGPHRAAAVPHRRFWSEGSAVPPMWLAPGTRLHRRTEADGKAILHERRGIEFHIIRVDVRMHGSGIATLFTRRRSCTGTRLLVQVQWNLEDSPWTLKRAIGMVQPILLRSSARPFVVRRFNRAAATVILICILSSILPASQKRAWELHVAELRLQLLANAGALEGGKTSDSGTVDPEDSGEGRTCRFATRWEASRCRLPSASRRN
mmetsp:Transcript_6189/g.21780  ORF Transcript_6189/g.21780 Transcript_6189/m.21780 type:complete len:273 (+) Transcript_6189:318-1136(+)